MILIIFLCVLFISGCTQEVIQMDETEFSLGENISFHININKETCDYSLPFAILYENNTFINIKHSCIGFEGHGVDCYCENNTINCIRYNNSCSDAIYCGIKNINEDFSWNQIDFKKIEEKCDNHTIMREEPSLVGPGTYKIRVVDNKGKLHEKVFIIR